jgi:hypothetical protein
MIDHISTYVMIYHFILFIIGLCNNKKVKTLGNLMSKTILLHINIITIMFLVPQCNISNKEIVILTKLIMLLICFYYFRKEIHFSFENIIPSVVIILLYISFVDYDSVYKCDVHLVQIIYSIIASIVIYLITMCFHKKYQNKLEDIKIEDR